MVWNDGENGENFMTGLGFPQYGKNRDTSLNIESQRRMFIGMYLTHRLMNLERDIKELKEEIERLQL